MSGAVLTTLSTNSRETMDRQFFDTVKARLLRDKDLREALHLECIEAERTGQNAYAETLRSLLSSATQ